MSIILYEETRLESLAARIAESAAAERRDPFQSPLILVPNQNVKKWLSLQIAQWRPPQADFARVAINLDIRFFEAGLWDVLVELGDFKTHNPQRLTREVLQWMIAAILMAEPADSLLAPLLRYLGAERGPEKRQYARKLWQVSDRLARLFREYETHRPEMIRQWTETKKSVRKQPAGASLFEQESEMYICQRALYRRLFSPGGLRDALAKSDEETYYSLPQIASEVLHSGNINWSSINNRETLRVFVLPQLSAFFVELLQQLGTHLNIELYNLRTSLSASPCVLKDQWGKAEDVKNTWLRELKPRRGPRSPKDENPPKSILERVQNDVMGVNTQRPNRSGTTEQDCSVQIAGCPSIRREVETVCNSIVHKMMTEPDLKLTDIAILVPDMTVYKPVLESVLNRQPQMLTYNLIDATAADDSVYAQAVNALLKLGEGKFVRREVFELLMNPCFLAAHGMQREDALVWLNWADKLNIFREFAVSPDSPVAPFSWQHGLRRLRLGRLLECPSNAASAPEDSEFFDYQKVVPFADMESESAHEVSRFSLSIETLAITALELGEGAHTAEEWHQRLTETLQSQLRIPHDRLEEYLVQSTFFQALASFKLFDKILPAAYELSRQEAPEAAIGLPLMQEFVRDNLASIPSRVGHYLLDGVTVSALRPDRPMPFKIVYLLGLGEGQYPGSEQDSTLDIRTEVSQYRGEVSQVEAARQCFLDTLLGARRQLYLTYVARNLQKDEVFQPCSLVSELETYISQHILDSKFEEAKVPLRGASSDSLLASKDHKDGKPWCDLFERHYWPADNLAALSTLLSELETRGNLSESVRTTVKKYEPRIKRALQKKAFRTQNTESAESGAAAEFTITLFDLEKWLINPIEGSLAWHLRMADERENDMALEEDEPFSSSYPFDIELLSGVFRKVILQPGRPSDPEKLIAASLDTLKTIYGRSSLCGGVPPGAFGELDRTHFGEKAKKVLFAEAAKAGKQSGLATFLNDKVERIYCGSVVIGQKRIKDRDAIVFPALKLKIPGGEALLQGDQAFIYDNEVETCKEILVLAPTAGRCMFSPAPRQKKVPVLSKHAIRPFLFYLSMLAGTEKNAAGLTSAKWWGDRHFRIWIAYKDGILAWNYDRFSAKHAREYLEKLAGELTTSQNFDLLPFEVVNSLKYRPFELGGALPENPLEYAQEIERRIAGDEDSEFSRYRPAEFLNLIQPRVPPDALQKVTQRLTPLFRAAILDPDGVTAGEDGDD